MQQDLEDRNDKIFKLENANLSLLNKVNNLMAKNVEIIDQNIIKGKQQDDVYNDFPNQKMNEFYYETPPNNQQQESQNQVYQNQFRGNQGNYLNQNVTINVQYYDLTR